MKIRSIVFATIAAGATLFGAAAHAGSHWSIGINVPVPGLVVSNDGYYAEPAPVYYAPVPAPRYVAPEVNYEAPRVYVPPRVVYSSEQPAYEVQYGAEPYRAWNGDRDSRWEQHREFERARWEHARHEHDEHHWERGEHGRDDGDAHSWHRD